MEMEKEIEISKELDLDITFEDGRFAIAMDYEGKLAGARVVVYTDAAKLVDKITDLIPGEWDDSLLDGLAARLLAKKTNV